MAVPSSAADRVPFQDWFQNQISTCRANFTDDNLTDIITADRVRKALGRLSASDYTLVSTDPLYSIGWGEINGRILNLKTEREINGGNTAINLNFDKTLGVKLRELTERTLNLRLAVIVDNRVLLAPQIKSTMSNSVAITGKFSDEQLDRLRLGLVSAQVASATDITTSPPSKESSQKSIFDKIPYLTDSKVNLAKLGQAIQGFENATKMLPGSTNMSRTWGMTSTAAVYPCSWRVGILPYLNEKKLYELYRFDEPWDSKHNLTLLENMPKIYRSPFAPEAQPAGNTNYLGFSSDMSALGKNGVPLQVISDGPASTLLLVETKQSVPWTKPEDFPFANYLDAKYAIPFDHHRLHFLTADCAVHTMPQPIDWGMLGKLITRNGGEKVELSRPLGVIPDQTKRLKHSGIFCGD